LEEVSDMAEKVTTEVILRSANGSSILDAKEGITAENIEKYKVGREVIEEASKKLEELGFEVLQAGPVGLTISGDRALFESVFQTTLEARSMEIMPTKVSGAGVSYYEAIKPIKIPEDLSPLIADVALPAPPEFFP
jgi:subtilase family serine protease